ncbi:hypothetical protein [Iamia sp.]|uniref:hypothetical protein n=1 Tax=Iamia sp. TaxID=2722710 RepID=UPI002CA96569|nr:hypothetical protein [Iamia sp.]HXH58915.1 hypothetical protein [Iamia sp.]
MPCVACHGLYVAYRTNSRTCSGACRVALHRDPDLDTFEKAAADTAARYGFEVDPFDVRRINAIGQLRPDLTRAQLAAAIDENNVDIFPEYIEQLSAAAQTPPSCAAPSTASPGPTP